MNKKLYSLVVLAILSIIISCEQQNTTQPAPAKVEEKQAVLSPQKLKPDCTLTMGWDPWAPYQYLTPDNNVKGLEIELISAIAKEAGCGLKFVQNDWMHLLGGIRDGSIDLLGGASKTPARDEFALFSTPYRHESFVLYVRSEQSNAYANKTLEQLLQDKFKLGVTEDYIYGDEISVLQDSDDLSRQITYVPITEVNYYNLTQNKIDGFLEDPFVAAYTIKRKGLSQQIAASPIEVHSGDVAIMFSKVSVKPETVTAFNKGLELVQSSGEYQKILDRYNL
ncbi:MAG: transporter substrate-binding domain-containing protein [Kangiellaceae bacterium]|nr:transporter substrate-binding domain-containing protein [Kangiellaceae bacterium]